MKQIIGFSFLFNLYSCDKFFVNRHDGLYHCSVEASQFQPNLGASDTVFSEIITAYKRGDYLEIDEILIPADSLRNRNEYKVGAYSNGGLRSFKLIEDSLYTSFWGGGLGGGTVKKRKCKKIN